MAFRATLSFAGKEFDVLDCTYSLKRDVDSKGRPSSNIYGDKFVCMWNRLMILPFWRT